MTSDVVYLTSFRQLWLSETMTGDFTLLPGVQITNDPNIKRRLLSPDYARYAGLIELDHLQTAPNLVFGELRESDMCGAPAGPFLRAVLLWIEGLFDNAWLLKDHALRCETVHLAHRTQRGTVWTSNFLATSPSFADGTVEQVVEMSLSDLKLWAQINNRVESYLYEAKSSRTNFMLEKGYTRSGRAMRFVKAARGASDMAFKISHYCSALETLFTTGTTELSHKLSERAAFFLDTRGHDKLRVFTTVKRAYDVRSKLVHGETLTPRQVDDMPQLSTEIDGYLRTILNAIFEIEDLRRVFDTHSNAVEEYFTRLILGDKESDA